ncbi:DNA/RNA helicase domain-containing protein [Epilithonimonas xixisoli]|uniref:DNA/RNA helicase domain-containing protein n=1 Tax=Epilithonimonas xixisoli TaxID=1476462 RepID=UPI0014170088|nr:DNA/RNA helicase domain-containing protein [Epilithonimonas xixisoli]
MELYLFTYISSENKFYKLDIHDNVIEVDVLIIINLLNRQFIDIDFNLGTSFNPSDFLVSPFNSTDKFINNEYFLTADQDEHKRKIINDIEKDNKRFIVVKGQPGSGKTLLIYDIAKYFINKKNACIIHYANLNEGQDKLVETYNWNIVSIKYYRNTLQAGIEVIIIDECQRIRVDQLNEIIQHAKQNNIVIIFSYDERQVLQKSEKSRNIPKIIETNLLPEIHTLNGKIRTNKEISAFIKSLFDKSRLIEKYRYDSVELLYLNNMEEAKSFMKSNIAGDWTIINYTPSLYDTHQYEKYYIPKIGTKTHNIIGQEFDKVVVVIDNDFKYVNDSLTYSKSCYYNPEYMLYQNITRARNKIKVIVINNTNVLERCLQILNIEKK